MTHLVKEISMIRKLLLFDIDGTLLHSKGASREAKALAMEEVFGTAANVRTHSFGGKTDWQILREVLEPHGVTGLEIGQKMPAFERIFAKNMAKIIPNFDVETLPGSTELLDYLQQRDDILLGIVTGNTSQTAPIKLKAAGFDPAMFLVGAYGSEADDRNDLPKLALDRAIAHVRQNISGQDVIIIGDTVKDVEAARAIGGVAVTVFTGFEDRQRLIDSKPDYMLDDLTTFRTTVPL
ncbi:MAG: HAD hydrolase-like protein [Phototrophicaceae bacterium]